MKTNYLFVTALLCICGCNEDVPVRPEASDPFEQDTDGCYPDSYTISGDYGLEELRPYSCIAGDLEVLGLSIPVDLPNLTRIKGSLIFSMTDLVNLEGLNSLETIDGDLSLQPWPYSFVNFKGLDSLTEVGGSVKIVSNEYLQSFEGFENLKRIGLALAISDNGRAVNFHGFDGLEEIGGDLGLLYSYVESSEGFANLKRIGQSLKIVEFGTSDDVFYGPPHLTTIDNSLVLQENWFNVVAGFDSLQTIGGIVDIQQNNQLYWMELPRNIQTEKGLMIVSNPKLPYCAVCPFITPMPDKIAGTSPVQQNDPDFCGREDSISAGDVNCPALEDDCLLGGYAVETPADLALFEDVTCIWGDLFIYGTDLISPQNTTPIEKINLPNLERVTGEFAIIGERLTAIENLDRLSSVGTLTIYDTTNLPDLSGLSALTSITNELYISTDSSTGLLAPCDVCPLKSQLQSSPPVSRIVLNDYQEDACSYSFPTDYIPTRGSLDQLICP